MPNDKESVCGAHPTRLPILPVVGMAGEMHDRDDEYLIGQNPEENAEREHLGQASPHIEIHHRIEPRTCPFGAPAKSEFFKVTCGHGAGDQMGWGARCLASVSW